MANAPTLARTIERLRESIRAGEYGPSGVLPSIQTLASRTGVSLVTAWKAVQALKGEGLLSGKRGCPLVVMPASPDRPEARDPSADFPQPKLKWRHLAAWMKRDLLAGAFRPGQSLPPIKELARRYGVSYPTIRKTLTSLVEEDVIRPHVSGFRVTPLGPAETGRNRVVLITRVESLGRTYPGVLFVEFLRRMEESCRAAQVMLDIVTYSLDHETPEYTRWSTGERIPLRGGDDPLGYVYMPMSYGDEQEIVVRELSLSRVPLVIVDDSGLWEYPPWLLDRPFACVFRLGLSDHPAHTVARYLLGLGHRRIAYLSPFHFATWSQTRLAGFTAEFEGAGLHGSVVPLVLNAWGGDYLARADRSPAGSALADAYQHWRQSAPQPYARQFDPFMTRIFTVESAHADIRTSMGPLFEMAHADKSITAWVAANDLIAGLAADFCKDRGIHVPGDISIIGFDDSTEALNGNLSSYNFNLTSMADAALSFLLQRHNPLLPRGQRVIDIEGAIAPRGSTGGPGKPRG